MGEGALTIFDGYVQAPTDCFGSVVTVFEHAGEIFFVSIERSAGGRMLGADDALEVTGHDVRAVYLAEEGAQGGCESYLVFTLLRPVRCHDGEGPVPPCDPQHDRAAIASCGGQIELEGGE